jgi:hypothetical protein
MLKRALEETQDALEHWFAQAWMMGDQYKSMLVVVLAMLIEMSFGVGVIALLVKLWKYVLMQ